MPPDGDGGLVTVRRSKTNQVGETRDVQFVRNGALRAIRTLRAATSPEPGDCVVPLSTQMVGLRFTPAAAGIRAPGDGALGTGRAGERSHQSQRVNPRRDARRLRGGVCARCDCGQRPLAAAGGGASMSKDEPQAR